MMEVTNLEVTKKERRHVAAHGEARLPAQRPVLLHYAIARHGLDGPRLLHIPLGFGEEALVVFSSWEAGRGFYVSRRRFLPEVFSEEWYVRKCSTGELVSLLLGPYKGIEWVLFDPPLGERFVAGSTQADLMSRERFIEHLLD